MRSGSFCHFANKHELQMAVMEEGLRLERTHGAIGIGNSLAAAEQTVAPMLDPT